MVTAALIQVLVLVLTLAAASGAVPMATARLDATAIVDGATAAQPPSRASGRAGSIAAKAPRGACPSVTAGRVVASVDQGRGPMPPPMA
ncbi:MAG: hypothetical protein DWH90_00820 [Planctomycetota bacterium]|nr:MAG: hypothetical protein DWH90_00820 [Planctomycetota bacterium]